MAARPSLVAGFFDCYEVIYNAASAAYERYTMVSKILKIVLDAVLSIVVLFVTAVLSAWVAGFIVGSSKDASGQEVLNGGAATSLTILVVCAAVTIVFAVWFYRFLINHKFIKDVSESERAK
jgi:uncharacterized membrane protein